jgi:hypothetical protein
MPEGKKNWLGSVLSPPITLLNADVDFTTAFATHGKGVRTATNPNVQVLLGSAHFTLKKS